MQLDTKTENIHTFQRQRTKRERAKVIFFSAWALLGFPRTFFWWTSRKKDGWGPAEGRTAQGKSTDGARKPDRWWCKAVGRYSLCNFCMKPSVQGKAGAGSRLSLIAVVAKARFYCTSCSSLKVSVSMCFDVEGTQQHLWQEVLVPIMLKHQNLSLLLLLRTIQTGQIENNESLWRSYGMSKSLLGKRYGPDAAGKWRRQKSNCIPSRVQWVFAGYNGWHRNCD